VVVVNASKWFLCSVSLLLSNGIFADGDELLAMCSKKRPKGETQCCPKEACAPTCCTPTCCPPIVEDCCFCNVCPPTSVITPKAAPCVKDGVNLFITADFIYWGAKEDQLEFCQTVAATFVTGTPVTNLDQGSVIRPDLNWNPGFKAGLGYDFCHDGWDVYAEYTWYHVNNFRTSVDITDTSLVIADAYWGVNLDFTTPFYQTSSSRWNLHFNVIDANLGRNFYVSPRLAFRPSLGLKGTWQKQNYRVEFATAAVDDIDAADNVMNNKMNYWGVGIRGGLNSSWHFTREFSLIGDLALTGLWETFNVTRVDRSALTGINNVNEKDNFSTLKPVIEWMIGLRWEMWICCDAYHLAFDAAYEQQFWLSQNQLQTGFFSSNGDLVFQGLTAKARFDF